MVLLFQEQKGIIYLPLKEIRRTAQISMQELLSKIDLSLTEKIKKKQPQEKLNFSTDKQKDSTNKSHKAY